MKVCLLVLCLLPVVLCAPQKKFLESIGSTFNLDILKCDVQLMLDALGSDPTEAACESECHKLLQQGHTFNYACPIVCHGFQNLVHMWHIVPDTTDPTVSKCNKPDLTVG